jgi:3-deoxy-D-manno-octulosonic-acid transferase
MATIVNPGSTNRKKTAKDMKKSSSVWKYILHPRHPKRPHIKKANIGDFFDLRIGRKSKNSKKLFIGADN